MSEDDDKERLVTELTALGAVGRADADDLAVFILQMIHGIKIGDPRQATKWRDAITRKFRKLYR